MNRQTGSVCQYTGADISKISTWHRNHRWMFFIPPLFVRKKIIKLLRQPSCHIDRVGRSKKKFFIQFLVGKSLFDHLLAIIECSFNFKCMNIFSKSGQLFFLYRAYFAGWIKYDYLHSFYIIKSIGNSAACITGCGDQYGYFPVLPFKK